jgi:hypothetical protein
MGPAPQASRGAAPDLPRGPLTRAGPGLEQVGISVAFQEENARQTVKTIQGLRTDLDQFIAGQDKRLEAIEAMLLKLGQRMDKLGSQNST